MQPKVTQRTESEGFSHMFRRFNSTNLEAIFADIDGSTRGKDKFAKNLPYIAKVARLILGIPIIPVTARDLNGWLSIKDFNKVFGTRRSSLYNLKTMGWFGKKSLAKPENPEQIKRYIRKYGCVVLNNGGTIATLDGRILFRHYTFLEVEREAVKRVFKTFINTIDSIELSGPPGGSTKLFLCGADEKRLIQVRSEVPSGFSIFALSVGEPEEHQVAIEMFEKVLENDMSSKIGISCKDPSTNQRIIEMLDEFDMEITSNEGSLTVSTRGVNKRSGIEWIAKHLDLDLSNCVFIGNDHNDAPALTHPNIGIPIVVGDPKHVSTERLIRKYGNLHKKTIIVESYDDLFKALQPLLTSKRAFPSKTEET
jgi:hydroxymethylpyrimidine pyrophosphatase-like HAD family hydrolase